MKIDNIEKDDRMSIVQRVLNKFKSISVTTMQIKHVKSLQERSVFLFDRSQLATLKSWQEGYKYSYTAVSIESAFYQFFHETAM